MTSRGRGGSISDWDPLRDDFNDSYNAYPDEDASEAVALDNNKLFVTRLPTALSQDGFVDLFSKYGRVVHSYFSRDPLKKYAFVTFETAGEARIAMMKLNKTEPFNMNISFAHNKNATRSQHSQPNIDKSNSNTDRPMKRYSNTERQNHSMSVRGDSTSTSSKDRKLRNSEEHANGNDDEEETEESDVGHDPKFDYDLEKIKLQRLQIMDQQLRVHQRMLVHQQRMKSSSHPVTKRRLLPDGRSIQVTQDNENNFTAGGGDSPNIPGLQREPCKRCVACGAPAELYCAGCRITPYCDANCQRRDWEARHRAVCHNLARSSVERTEKTATNAVSDVPCLSTLRRPHSPREKQPNDTGSEREGKNFIPPAEKHAAYQLAQQRKDNQLNIRANRNQQDGNLNQAGTTETKGTTKTEARTKPVVQDNMPGPGRPVRVASLEDALPRKPPVPSSFLIEKLAVGTVFLAEAIAPAAECGSKQPGRVCLTLHEDYGDLYDSLCEPLKELCQKDAEQYTPCIGETFAYYCSDDEFWYRARCLARTRAALLDAGRVVSLTPAACRRLPPSYSTVPEFMAVLKSDDLSIGENFSCTITNTSGGIRVSVEGAGKSAQVDVERWIPDIEYTTEPQRPLRQPNISQLLETKAVKPVQASKSPSQVEPSPIKRDVPTPVVKVIEPKPETPKPLVPDSYVVGKLAVGATFLAEAMAPATECGSKQPGRVCLTLHEDYGDLYDSLCEPLKELCQKDAEQYTPGIGETFAYYCSDDEFWYRARCLARTRAALLDAGRVVSLTPAACRRLPPSYSTVPEFMAVLKSDDLSIGNSLSCTVVSVNTDGIRVSVEDAGATVEVDATRWLPDVEYPGPVIAIPATNPSVPITMPAPNPSAPTIMEVPRPDIERNTLYILLDATSLHRACIRPSDPRLAAMFDSVIQDTLLYAMDAKPLKEPPQKGQTVVAKFVEDGLHYRAFVKRISVAKNKYLIEYIEYGNEEIVPLERLYACPPKLRIDSRPTQASLIKLSEITSATLTPAAVQYVNNLKDNAVELILTIPSGVKTAPSGSLAVLLVAKNCEPASKKIEDLCTPEWKKLVERGGNVLEMETCFYDALNYTSIPADRPFTLQVTFCDATTLAAGALNGHEKGDKNSKLIYGELDKQIAEYCESPLCREPYLPRLEELCITKNKRLNKWVRSVLVELPQGPGSSCGTVVHLDTGELQLVPVGDMRKMPREFVEYRAIAHHCDIKDFPDKVSRAQIERAMKLMGVSSEGTGELSVLSCLAKEDQMYEIYAPDLIAALTQ